jgi:hypothetical protein
VAEKSRHVVGGSHAREGTSRLRRPGRRRLLVKALPFLVPVVAGTVVIGTLSGSPSSSEPSQVAGPCRGRHDTLTVAAAPEIAQAVRRAATAATAAAAWRKTPCAVRVSSLAPAALVTRSRTGSSDVPDIWIPDSSLWVSKARLSGVAADTSVSIATSPVVLAASRQVAEQIRPGHGRDSLERILDNRTASRPVTLGLPDPRRSAESVGALIGLEAAVSARPDAREALTWALRAGPGDLGTSPASMMADLRTHPRAVLPSSEQQVWRHDHRPHSVPVDAVRLPQPAMQLDYPYVALRSRDSAAAGALLAFLRGPRGRAILAGAGFRDGDGRAEGALAADPTIAGAAQGSGANPPSIDAVDRAVGRWTLSNEPSRLLAVLDVSGSMGTVVAGAGGATRLQLTKQAAAQGLGLYSRQSEVGLWTFSTNLTKRTDYRRLVPIEALGRRSDDTSGKARLMRALAGVHAVRGGGTGLYDTTLAAVRAVRSGWDPNRVNSVLILSDGRNDDDGMSLGELLRRLTDEQDPARPVPVTAIAFGPGGDIRALRRISEVTGGSAYEATDPATIARIFLDSVGQRLCRPFC